MTNLAGDIIRLFCNGCQQDTNHEIVVSCTCERREGDVQFPRVIKMEWRLAQCRGCDLIKAFVTEESTDFKSPREIHYPARQARRLPEWSRHLPEQLQDLVREIYDALHAKCLCLSAMGARTLIDVMLLEMFGDIGGFDRKLNEAVNKGLLTNGQKDTIAAAVEAGHAAVHRRFKPTEQDLYDVLDIIEHALEGQYVMKEASRRLERSVPPRGTSTR